MRKTIFSLLMLACSVHVLAQMPQYYTGGTASTSSNGFPYSTAGKKIQEITLTTDYQTAPPSGIITKVYFRSNGAPSGSSTFTNLNILMMQTSATGFSGTSYLTGLTNVLSSAAYVTTNVTGGTSGQITTGWIAFTLTTPFLYDNTKNLIVEVNQTGTSSGWGTWHQLMSPATRRLYGDISSPTTATGLDGYLWDFGFDLLPKQGYNNAALNSVSSPVAPFCPGLQQVNVQVKNSGYNRINNVKIFWEINGVPQTPVTYSNLIDTIGGSFPNTVTVPLGTYTFNGSPSTFKFYTSIPNGIPDTVNNNDTLVKILGPSPTAVITPIGTTIFCTAGVINAVLNAPTGIGNNYQWKLNGSPIPGALGSSYTAIVAGDYSVTLDSNGCSNTSAVIRVDNLAMPMPLVTPSGYPVLCTGDSIAMVGNAGVTGASYQWKYQGNDIPGATTSSYTAYNPGNYVLVTSKLICNATSQGVNIIPKSKPVLDIKDSSAVGIHVLSTDPSMQTYQWYISTSSAPTPSPIPGAIQFVYIARQNGNYTVVGNNGGCDGFSDTVYVNDLETGIDDVGEIGKIRVYPNPVTNQLYISAPAGSSMIVCGTDGRTLMQQVISKNAIDLTTVPSGIYQLKVINKNGLILKTDKLIKSSK